MSMKFQPLLDNHPLVTEKHKCPVCEIEFKAGDITTIIPLGPSNDEDRLREKEGRSYNAAAACVHWNCCAQQYKEEE